MDAYIQALHIVLDPYILVVMLCSGLFGLVLGCLPGVSATMATALLVPVTFFMPPVAAIAAIVTATAMAVYSGDIPGCLLRIPGTPASAAYTDDAYKLTLKGQAGIALGASLVFSAVGGLIGTFIMMVAAPSLANVALKFSSFEFFWMCAMGLTCAALLGNSNGLKAAISTIAGLLLSTIGMENPAAFPRFTFGLTDLSSGLGMIPVMVGMFAVAEILRNVTDLQPQAIMVTSRIGNIFAGQWLLAKKYWKSIIRGCAVGNIIGIQPGSGSDTAAWVSYAMSKKFSKEPEKFGTGHAEGIVEAGASNNSSLAGAWIPALVFGIPGDSITAIAVGVMFMKGLNPGPSLFTQHPENIYAIFLIFVIANLIMLPLGWLTMKIAVNVLSVPKNILMPLILLICIVGSFAINNTVFDVGTMLVIGVLAFIAERNGFPVAPAILGLVLGPMLEDTFVTSMIKSNGSVAEFFTRPIALGLALATFTIVLWPLLRMAFRWLSHQPTAAAGSEQLS